MNQSRQTIAVHLWKIKYVYLKNISSSVGNMAVAEYTIEEIDMTL